MSARYRGLQNQLLYNYNQRVGKFEQQIHLSGSSLKSIAKAIYRNAQTTDSLRATLNTSTFSNITVTNNTVLNDNLVVNGFTQLNGGTSFTVPDELILNTLTVNNTSTFEGPIVANNTLSVSGTTTFDNTTTINGELALNGNVTSNFYVKNASVFVLTNDGNNSVQLSSDRSISVFTGDDSGDKYRIFRILDGSRNNLKFQYYADDGNTTNNLITLRETDLIISESIFDANVIVSTGSFTVSTGNSTVQNLSVIGLLNASSLASFSDNVTIGGTLGVTGNTTTQNLTVNNQANIGGTLGVTGNTTVTNLSVGGLFNATDLATFSNNVSIGGTLGVTGNTTVQNLTVNGSLAFTNVSISGTLDVTGEATFSNNVTINGANSLILVNGTSNTDISCKEVTINGGTEGVIQTDTQEYLTTRLQKSNSTITNGTVFDVVTTTKDIVQYIDFNNNSTNSCNVTLPNFKSANNDPSLTHLLLLTNVNATSTIEFNLTDKNSGVIIPSNVDSTFVFSPIVNGTSTGSSMVNSPYTYSMVNDGYYMVECISTGGPKGQWIIKINGP